MDPLYNFISSFYPGMFINSIYGGNALIKQLSVVLKQGHSVLDKPELKIESAFRILDVDGQPIDSRETVKPGSVAVVDCIGPMFKYTNWWYWGADALARAFANALANPNVVGGVIRMDTPGGQISSIPMWLQAINSSKKPIVSHADICMSAGYHLAVHTRYIMADNEISSTVGSIGAMIVWEDIRKMLEEWGIEIHEIYPDESSYKNEESRELLNGNQEPVKTRILSPAAKKFQDDVRAQRAGLLDTKVEGILEGRTFRAQEALTHGMIDGIGSMDDAVRLVQSLANVKKSV